MRQEALRTTPYAQRQTSDASSVMRRASCVVLLLAAAANGADIYARRMEIIKTPEGQETVFRDSVSITDGDTRITARRARINEQLGVAVIADFVFIETPDALVWADSAVYLMAEKRTELFGNVRVQQESLLITAPVLFYSIPDRLVEAGSGLVIRSSGRDFELTGERGWYDLAGDTGVVDSSPVLVQATGDDSVIVTAQCMSWHDLESRAVAQGGVRVGSGRAALLCDTLSFFPGSDSGMALGNPQVSDSLSRTAGDTITILLDQGQLDIVTVSGNAQGHYVTEGEDEVEFSGQSIRIEFDQGEAVRVEVERLASGKLVRRSERAAE